MTAELPAPDFQTQVLTELRNINARLERLETHLGQFEGGVPALAQRVDKWEERFLQLTRDNLTVSRTVIIAAATAVVFAPLVKELAPAIVALLKSP